MKIAIHHVALIVQNVDIAKDFYRKVFEFPDRKRLTETISVHRGAWFQIGDLELHLQERTEETVKNEQHLAFITDQFDELVSRTIKFGGRFEEAKLIAGVKKRCFIYDIDNNRIELLEK